MFPIYGPVRRSGSRASEFTLYGRKVTHSEMGVGVRIWGPLCAEDGQPFTLGVGRVIVQDK